MNDFDMNLIKPFVKVYEFNSITKAAEFFNVSQPAISGSIKRLENYLDYPLFVRNGRNLTATPSGKSFYEQVANIIDITDNALGNKSELVVYAQGNILLMLTDINNIQLIESQQTEDEIFNDLRMRKVDLVIDYITQKDNTFVCELVRKEYFKLVCRKEHPLIKEEITLDQYNQLDHIATNSKRNNQRAMEHFTESSVGVKRNIKAQVTSSAATMLAVLNSDYVAAIPESMVKTAKHLDLQVFELPFTIRPIEYSFVYHKRFSKDPEHKKLRDLIRAKINNL